MLAVAEKPAKSIRFSALEFTGVVQQNGHGSFDYFAQDLSKESGVEFDYHVMSPARGAKAFFAGQKDCLIPSSAHPPYFEGLDVIHSEQFAQVLYLAFTLPDQPKITNKRQLKGKVIGVLRDESTWNYEKRFDINGATYVKVGSLESLVEMLYRKRVDVAIHDHQDFISVTEFFKHAPPNYSITNPMAVDNVVITCHNNRQNQTFIETINPIIVKFVERGLSYYYEKATID